MAKQLKATELVAASKWLEEHRDGLGQWSLEQIGQRLAAKLNRHVSVATAATALRAAGLHAEWKEAINRRRGSSVSAQRKRQSRERMARLEAIEHAVRELYRRCGEPCPLAESNGNAE